MTRYENLSEVETKDTYAPIHKLEETENAVLGYLSIRKWIGIIGMSLPILIFIISMLSPEKLLPSISDYYYTLLNPLFTGGLLLISVFLFASRTNEPNERILNRVAGVAGIAIIVFPTNIISKYKIIPDRTYCSKDFSPFIHYSCGFNEYVGYLHIFAALIFFILLTIIVFIKFIPFEEQYNSELSKHKIKLYKYCGFGMGACLILLILSNILVEPCFGRKCEDYIFPLTFTLESILLFLFGVCWFTKSNSLDKILNN